MAKNSQVITVIVKECIIVFLLLSLCYSVAFIAFLRAKASFSEAKASCKLCPKVVSLERAILP